MKSKVAIVRCGSYEQELVFQAVKRCVDLIGGVSNFIKTGSRVLVKPNLLLGKEPESGIDTHPEVVRAVIKLLKGLNCEVFVGDGPSIWVRESANVDEVYEKSGIKRISEEEKVSLVKFDKRRWHGKFPLTFWLDDCDYLVSVPKFKTHELTILTASIKNLYGLVSGTFKAELHKNYFNMNDFAKILVDIYQEAKPALTVIDGVVAMEGDGPGTSGKLRNENLLLASSDGVALDSILSIIMGLKPYDILSTKEAAARGLGTADISSIEILGEKLNDVIARPFLLPSSASLKKKLPKPVVELAKRLVKLYPCLEPGNCTRCAACIDACPNKAISIRKEKAFFDYSKCIACFCCQEVCPNAAIKIRKSFLAKFIGL